jgi:hypothetical protein
LKSACRIRAASRGSAWIERSNSAAGEPAGVDGESKKYQASHSSTHSSRPMPTACADAGRAATSSAYVISGRTSVSGAGTPTARSTRTESGSPAAGGRGEPVGAQAAAPDQ